jgi:hypothetical protein
VSVPGPGRWATVALSVALLWIFGFAAEARAEIGAVADTTTTEDVASTDAGSGDSVGAIPDEGTSTATEPVDTSTGTEPAPTPEPIPPVIEPTPTDPVATDPPPEPAPIPPVIEPTPTDPVATDPPPEPAPTPEPIPPVIEPTPTTETPPDTPPVSQEPAGSGLKPSIVVLDEPLASAPLPPSQGATFIGISPAGTDRGSELTPTPEHTGNGHHAPAAPDLPQLPAPHNPSAPANPAPGGVGGTGSSALGVLAALFALAFAGLLGEVLPVRVAALRPPDLAFHLKRPG